jgi:arsenite-transporting ATPase
MASDVDGGVEERVTTQPRVIFFSGKGGVGKTTLAGTAAVWLAATGQSVLVASTDPAHSLSDLFDVPIGGAGVVISTGLEAVEIDAPATIDSLIEGIGGGPLGAGAAAATDLLKLASNAPGVDEIVSLDMLLRLIETPMHDALVLDTAPTGHTLRLLALPELMDRYFGRLMKWRRQISRIGKHFRRIFRADETVDTEELGEHLAGAQGRMQMLGELLRDPHRCLLVLVTIPEAMSVLETMRTMEFLGGQGMPVAAVAVNMLQSEQQGCAFCHSRRRSQMVHLDRLRTLVGSTPIVVVESEVEEPRGTAVLACLAEKVWSRHPVLS